MSDQNSNSATQTIYIPLFDEGTDVVRPTQGALLASGPGIASSRPKITIRTRSAGSLRPEVPFVLENFTLAVTSLSPASGFQLSEPDRPNSKSRPSLYVCLTLRYSFWGFNALIASLSHLVVSASRLD